MRELLKGGLLHEDVHTVAGFGLSRYTLEPWLNNGELDWREGATAPLDDQVIATFEKPFSRHGGTKVLSGNLGRAVMKLSRSGREPGDRSAGGGVREPARRVAGL